MKGKHITRRRFLRQTTSGAICIAGGLTCPSALAQLFSGDQPAGSGLSHANYWSIRHEFKGSNALICSDDPVTPQFVPSDFPMFEMGCELMFSGKKDVERCFIMIDGTVRSITLPMTFKEISTQKRFLEKLIRDKYEEYRVQINQEPARFPRFYHDLASFVPIDTQLVSVSIYNLKLLSVGSWEAWKK